MAVTAKFIADFTQFNAAVQAADVKLRTFQSNAGGVEKALSRMTDSFSGRRLIQDATLAAEAIERIGGVTKLTGSELQRASAQAKDAADKLRALGTEIPPKIQALANAIDDVPKKLSLAERAAGTAKTAFAGVFAGFTAATLVDRGVTSLINFGRAAVDAAGQTLDLSHKTGLSTDTIQRMQFVADQTGGSLEGFTNAAFKLGVNLSTAGDKTKQAISAIGLSFTDLQKLQPDQQFDRIAAALGRMDDVQERNRAGVALFGKQFSEIAPAIAEGYDKIAAAAQVSGDAQLQALDRASDRWDAFKTNASNALTGVIGNTVLLGDALREVIGEGGLLQTGVGVFAEASRRVQLGLVGARKTDIPLDPKAGSVGGPGVSDNFVKQLAAARREVEELTSSQRAQIAAAMQLGESTADLSDKFGISEAALRLFSGATKDATKGTDELKRISDAAFGLDTVQQVQRTLQAIGGIPGLAKMSADQTAIFGRELAEATSAAKRNGLTDIAKGFEQVSKAIPLASAPLKNIELATAATAVPPQLTAGTDSTLQNADGTLISYRDHAIEAAMATAQIGKAAENINVEIEHASETIRTAGWGESLLGSFKTAMSGLPQVIMGAIQGGGNVGGAVGGLLGGNLIGGLAGKLTSGLSGMFGKTIGGALGSVIPGLGTLLGSMIGPLIGKVAGKIWHGIQGLFGTDEEARVVNPARDQFLAQFGGAGTGSGSGFMNLAAQLTEVTGEEGGGSLFRALTQADTMVEFNAAVAAIQQKLEGVHKENTDGFKDTTDAADDLNLTLTGSDDAIKALGQTQDRVVTAMLGGFDKLIAKLDDFIARLGTASGLAGGLNVPSAPTSPAPGSTPPAGTPGAPAPLPQGPDTQSGVDVPQDGYYHSGGMVRRWMKAHRGMNLAPDEVPIIAQTGERVLNREETRAYNRGDSGAMHFTVEKGAVVVQGAGKNAAQLASELLPELIKQARRYNAGGMRRKFNLAGATA